MGERRRGLDHVLAVVQNQHHLPLADRGDDPVHRLRVRCLAEQRVAQPECAERRLRHVTVGADGRELDQPGPVRQVAEQRARGLRGQPGLPRTARPDQGGEPMFGDERADRGDIGVLADEAGQLGAQVGRAGPLPPAHLAAQQRHVQCGQLRRGVRAQLVGQGFPGALVHEQRLGVATGRHQGTHQRGDEPFPHRMRSHHVGQLRDQLRAVAEADLRVEPVLHGGQAQPFEPGDRRVERRTVLQTDVLHGRAAPQREGLAQPPHPVWVRVVAGMGDEAFEPHGVDGVGRHPQPVAVRLPLDPPVRQRLPQPRNQTLQGIRRVGGRLFTPDPVDERRLRDRVTRFEGEGDQQPAQPGARHVGWDAVVGANLERSQHPDLHPPILPWRLTRTGRRGLSLDRAVE